MRRKDTAPRKLRADRLSKMAFSHQHGINVIRESIYNTLRASSTDFVGLHIPELRIAVAKFGDTEAKRFLAFADALWKAEIALFDAQEHVR